MFLRICSIRNSAVNLPGEEMSLRVSPVLRTPNSTKTPYGKIYDQQQSKKVISISLTTK